MPPKFLPITSMAVMSYLRCTFIVPVIFYQKHNWHGSNPCRRYKPPYIAYELNPTVLKDKVVAQQSAYRNTLEDCFSDIYAFSVGYERATCFLRVDFNAPGAPAISEVRSTKEPGLCFKCGGLHFHNKYRKNKGHFNSKLQNYNKTNNFQKFHQNNYSSSQFPTGTLSFQASENFKPGDDI